jgi:hypothetical protein
MMDRKELERILDEHLSKGRAYLTKSQRYEWNRNTLKSYLVEVNTDSPVGTYKQFAEFIESLDTSVAVESRATDDPTLHQLFVGSRKSEFWVDSLDERFWILHSTEESSISDAALRSLVLKTPRLDLAWLPTSQLDSWTSELGSRQQITARFGMARSALSEDSLSEEALENGLLLKLAASADVSTRWNDFRTAELTASSMAMWSCRVVRRNQDQVAVDDVNAMGKITARGDSFLMHTEIVASIRNRYSAMIRTWEQAFCLRWVSAHSDSGILPVGVPAELKFPEAREEAELVRLIEVMFNCTDPFRLYGVPVRRGEGAFVVKGVDLHTGDKVDFEITRSMIRAYLASDGCGNVLARLTTNLQQFHDARMELR